MLQIKSLKKYFPLGTGLLSPRNKVVKALDGVSLEIHEGETFGLVGESGCGKSTLGYCVVRLIEPTAGQILFQGRNILSLKRQPMRALRRDIQMIFQDPASSLNPRMTTQQILEEPFQIHGMYSRAERKKRVDELLTAVGLEPSVSCRFPFEFSGGQRQRIGIARALALKPKFIVADEPVSALDVSIQAQVINLLKDLQSQHHLTYLFISHSLPIIEHVSDRIGVMYLGRLVEVGTRVEVCVQPRHPYTRLLMSSVPGLDSGVLKENVSRSGEIPNPVSPPSGCPFHPRCPEAIDRCHWQEPAEAKISETHSVRCHLVE
jgi:peptide/nickel transport system ATP-binding protein